LKQKPHPRGGAFSLRFSFADNGKETAIDEALPRPFDGDNPRQVW
jgi:hypothetical protein